MLVPNHIPQLLEKGLTQHVAARRCGHRGSESHHAARVDSKSIITPQQHTGARQTSTSYTIHQRFVIKTFP